MRGDIVYRVYGLHEGREKEYHFGTFRTIALAEAEIVKLRSKQMHGRNWAEEHHNKGFVIREFVVETNFIIPSLPKPRDKYAIRCTPKKNKPGTWDSIIVEVFRRGLSGGTPEKICEYERNLFPMQQFEPFRQGEKDYALISREYTLTAVLDLTTGRIIAEEAHNDNDNDNDADHFCPVGFYVPDWWDIHDDSTIPGSEYWRESYEWPQGDFGFVWGCIWGDDSSWKVQYLDLSQIQQGIVKREERFGYLELDTFGYTSPSMTLDIVPPTNSKPPHFIQVSNDNGKMKVDFSVNMSFNMNSGIPVDWKRLGNHNWE